MKLSSKQSQFEDIVQTIENGPRISLRCVDTVVSSCSLYFDQAGEAKPELLDDWDQRLVVTTLQVDAEGERIELNQVAEKDQVPGDEV